MATTDTEVLIVGAGLAGLAAALELRRAGVAAVVLDAGSQVGGRVRTDLVDGYRLDRGFQVLNPAYPAIARLVDTKALQLGKFWRAVRVSEGASSSLLGHPLDCPKSLKDIVARRYFSMRDLAALAALSARAVAAPARLLTGAADQSTAEELDRWGLSPDAIHGVLGPFLSGVFLEPDLVTSSRFFHLVWRCFLRAAPALPALGMGALPHQLAARLPPDSIRNDITVGEISPGTVRTDHGTTWHARAVVVATDGATAARLLPVPAPAWHGVTTWYFSAARSPLPEPVITISADRGPVVNSTVLSEVCPSYAPPGRALISASTLTDATEGEVRVALGALYRESTTHWELIERYAIPHALPAMPAPHTLRRDTRIGDGLYVCGDHRDTSSLQGALASGTRTARAVLTELRTPSPTT